jgi:laminin alpha 1/2
VFNIAESADIFVNATCGGRRESEVYCTHGGRHECGVCDATDQAKAHPIEAAVDGDETWWQSPSLQNGPEFHYVTITVDLKEVQNQLYKRPCI